MRIRTGPLLVAVLAVVLFVTALLVLAQRLAPEFGDVGNPPPPEACSESDPTADPTTGGCLTPTARRLYDRTVETFGPTGADRPLRSVTCWAERPGNPTSDHPTGRACDVFPTRAGTFPEGAERDLGWSVAQWARDNARDLGVRYVIWQGRIWYRGTGDSDGWGRPYTGGGVYDPADATGGHFDHVHISVGP